MDTKRTIAKDPNYPVADPNEIVRTFKLLFQPDDVVEIRVLGRKTHPKTMTGWVKAGEIESYAERIARLGDNGGGVYFTPQVLCPEVLERCHGQFVGIKKLQSGELRPTPTAYPDVAKYRYLLIDIDSIRFNTDSTRMTHCSANEFEAHHAKLVSDSVLFFFQEFFWPDPIEVTSGNGRHLYYRIPTHDSTGYRVSELGGRLTTILKIVDKQCSTQFARVDTSTYLAAQLMRLPGTIAKKGEHTSERPHRLCRILEVPNGWTVS